MQRSMASKWCGSALPRMESCTLRTWPARRYVAPLTQGTPWPSSPQFVYLDASDTLDARALHALHTNLDEVLHASDASETQALVVIDSLSMLQWCLPGPADAVHWDLVQWLRAVRKLCASRAAALVTLLHADACAVTGAPWDQGDERLFRYLLRTADVWVAVRELPSGRAADCDGELSVHALARPAAAAAMGDQGSPHLRAFLLHRYLPAKTQFLYRVLPDGTGPKLENGMRALVRVWARGNNPGLL